MPHSVVSKHNQTHLFQHICAGSKFHDISPEELCFADKYQEDQANKSKKAWMSFNSLNMDKWAFKESNNEQKNEQNGPFSFGDAMSQKQKRVNKINVQIGETVAFDKNGLVNKRGTVKFIGNVGNCPNMVGIELERREDVDETHDGLICLCSKSN